MRVLGILAIVVISSVGLCAAADSAPLGPVDIVVPAGSEPCVRFGADTLAEALGSAGYAPQVVAEPGRALVVGGLVLTLAADPTARGVPDKPESYAISRDHATVRVRGSDAVGTMYGAFDVAEQIEMMPEGRRRLERVKPRSASPFLRIRADNPFFTLEHDNSLSPWFYDESYWTRYLQQLARSRYNVLDIHAMYQIVQTGFPDLYPYFFASERYPMSRQPGEDQAKNLAMLNRIIEIAEQHGVKVALMNYSVSQRGLFTPSFGEKTLTRVDRTIDFAWAGDSPDPKIPKNRFTVRWQGQIEPEFSERYTLATEADDGTRLWVDGKLLIDDWTEHGVARRTAEIDLVAGRRYDIRLEYFENQGEAVVRLLWASASQPEQAVPSDRLYPTADAEQAGGLTGKYFVAPGGGHDALVELTRWHVTQLITKCPDLWMMGFRIGESGQSEDFYQRAYLPGVEDANRDIFLYTRTWGARHRDLAVIGQAYPGKFFIEIKYNGEHLGAPYHAIQDWGHAYSYQTYLDHPRYWDVIWQIRCNGTHRLFRWGDDEFMRRTVRSCYFGDGIGFTMEPITAYYSQLPEQYFKRPQDVPFMDYIFERHWNWYLMWGRLAYDPDTPDDVFAHYFRRRFGDVDGQRVYRLLVASSRILPTIYQSHCLSPDHRGMAPEFECGNDGGDIFRFTRVYPVDRYRHYSIDSYADSLLRNWQSARITPLEAADALDAAATECDDLMAAITRVSPEGGAEYRDLASDAQMLVSLACYYAAKLRGGTELALYRRSGDYSCLAAARPHIEDAVRHWDRLATIGEGKYLPLLDTLRMHTRSFTWREEGRKVHDDLDVLDRLAAEAAAAEDLRAGHVPVRRIPPGQPLTLRAGVASTDRVSATLRYRIGGAEWQTALMSPIGSHTLAATIPGRDLRDGSSLAYQIEVVGRGERTIFPSPGALQRVAITRDDRGPSIRVRRPTDTQGKESVRIEAAVGDPAGVAEVRLLHKVMPTGNGRDWQTTPMRKAGGRYVADLPLTPEGALFGVEAIDRFGNASRYPDPRGEPPPYLAIDPWLAE